MAFYIKKPTVIRAVQFGEREFIEWTQWLQKDYLERNWSYRFDSKTGLVNGFLLQKGIEIQGGGPGDYLVKEADGSLKAYSKEYFEENYEKAEVKKSGRTD